MPSFFSMPTSSLDGIRVIEGDKMASLFCKFLKEGLSTMIEEQEKLDKAGFATGPSLRDVHLGLVQTAYANGASTKFARDVLALNVKVVPTGVKHLHHAAMKFGIGVYYEANGHGTVLVHPETAKKLQEVENVLRAMVANLEDKNLSESAENLLRIVRQLLLFLSLANQVIRLDFPLNIETLHILIFSRPQEMPFRIFL
jgi:phosphomannomutase